MQESLTAFLPIFIGKVAEWSLVSLLAVDANKSMVCKKSYMKVRLLPFPQYKAHKCR